MANLRQTLDRIRETPRCNVCPPRGQPRLRPEDGLPEDLTEFYELAGGVTFFEGSDYAIQIVGPEAFVRANPIIVGEESPDDDSDSWYIVARGGSGEAVSIDCEKGRSGRCYDSFWDRHGVVGECTVVALSFTELLQRLLNAQGTRWYWLTSEAPAYGDAYDP